MPNQDELSPTPAHIPAALVYDFDMYSAADAGDDYQQSLTRLHREGMPDMFWTPRNGGHWVATRSDALEEIFKTPALFSSSKWNIPVERNMPFPNVPLNLDAPEHPKYRALIARALSPRAVNDLSIDARALTISLIESFYERGECEFVNDFALHLPIAIFMQIVDLPREDRALLLSLVEPQFRATSEEELAQGYEQIFGYVAQKVQERTLNPGDDLISDLIQAKIDGKPISQEKLMGTILLLLGAGLDTVAAMLGFFTAFLARNPRHRQQLLDEPDLIPNAVEELIRRFSIVTPGRIITQDIEFRGVQLKKGEMVALLTPLYGLDERLHKNPLTVDFNRPNAKDHLGFGIGVHICQGSMLGRTELRIFLEEWLKRIPNFRIKTGIQLTFSAGITSTLTRLPIEWDVP